jgi:hypothetical protein
VENRKYENANETIVGKIYTVQPNILNLMVSTKVEGETKRKEDFLRKIGSSIPINTGREHMSKRCTTPLEGPNQPSR